MSLPGVIIHFSAALTYDNICGFCNALWLASKQLLHQRSEGKQNVGHFIIFHLLPLTCLSQLCLLHPNLLFSCCQEVERSGRH